MDKQIGIYCIENNIDHKKYIGQSTDIHDRWHKHVNRLENQTHHNKYLQMSWNVYGKFNFTFSILQLCNESELDSLERYYINLFNTTDIDKGYNIYNGGKSKYSIPEMTRKLIGQSRQGKLHSEEVRKRMSENRKGCQNAFYGRHHTEDAKKKMHERHCNVKGENNPRFNPEPVICITTGEIFSSAYAAGRQLGLYSSSIRKCCEGKLKTTGGLEFQFYNLASEN